MQAEAAGLCIVSRCVLCVFLCGFLLCIVALWVLFVAVLFVCVCCFPLYRFSHCVALVTTRPTFGSLLVEDVRNSTSVTCFTGFTGLGSTSPRTRDAHVMQ